MFSILYQEYKSSAKCFDEKWRYFVYTWNVSCMLDNLVFLFSEQDVIMIIAGI